jgi:uncharacterized protein (TIGR03435 family)
MNMLVASIIAKITVTMALALCGVRLARHSRAAVRHVVLASAFAVLLVLPLASIVAPSVRVEVPIAAQVGLVSAPPETVPDVSSAIGPVDAGAVITPAIPRSRWASLPALVVVFGAFWIAGAAVFLLPIVAGLWQMRSMRRSGLPWRDGRSLLDPLASDARIDRPVEVLLHEAVAGPMTCGVVQPAVVLPMDARNWPREDLQRAMVHELEHVRRADWLSQCLARAVCACYWFHPLVWIAWRQLVLEAERACDDAVLRRSEATAYADQLVVLARRLSAAPSQPQLAMANRHDLAARVGAVLDSRQRRGRAGAAWVVLAIAASAVLVTTISPLRVVSASAASAATADQAAQTSADGPKFDIVSIKPCENEPVTPPGQRSSQGGFPSSSPGRFFIECGTVERLISTAYVQNGDPLTNQAARIGDVEWLKGVPGWLRSEKFTIEAKAQGTPDKKVMLGPMLRALLEDRFKLKIHRATDEAPMYVMTVAKGGLKIQPIGEDGCTKIDPDNPPGRDAMFALGRGPKPICGNMMMLGDPGKRNWTIGGTTMEHFAGILSTFMDRHVIDKTGISGEFNVRLEFAADEHVPGADKRERAGPPAATDAPVESAAPDGPTIFMALEQQLGLKLDSTKGPHGFLVIDHVERPSPNSGPAILQAPARTQGVAPKFEVASIRRCEPGDTGSRVAGGRSGGGGTFTGSPGRLNVTCMTVAEIVTRAYVQYGDPPPLNHPKWDAALVTGGPDWARSDRYTIEAKADGTPVQTAMMGAMLRALLEDRFQLKLHQDFRDVQAFALTVAASGIKLKPVDPASCTPPDPNNPGGPRTLGADGLVRAAGGENGKPLCTGGVGRHGADLTYNGTGQSLDRVSRTLGALVFDRPVIDKTNVTGQFSFHVEFANDENVVPFPSPGGTVRCSCRSIDFYRLRETAWVETRTVQGPAGIPRHRSRRASGAMSLAAATVFAGLVLAAAGHPSVAAADLTGQVLFSGLGVPGATVTARRGDRTVSTVSDEEGTFRFAGIDEGTWTVRVEMRGFIAPSRDVVVPVTDPRPTWTLTMRSYEEIVGSAPPPAPVPAPAAESTTDVADVDVINGSVNNGAATPFAQPRAFGNNRPRPVARYTGAVSAILGNSAWNARPYSFGGSATPDPSYGDAQIGFIFGGPLKIPRLITNGPQTTINYQHGVVHNATTQLALMPTVAERVGDLSQSSVAARDPLTGLPFPGNVIPANRIVPQAAALLAYYPLPNSSTTTGANYQAPIVTATRQDNFQLGMNKSIGRRTTLGGAVAYQRTVRDSVSIFDFADTSRQSSLTADGNWARRFGTRLSIRAHYQFTRMGTGVTPFFANRTNVSGDAGIAGNSQDPANWGPPVLSFPGVADLRDVDYLRSRGRGHVAGGEALFKRGRHNLTMGGDLRRNGLDVSSQPDPRGTLAFTGAATGNAFADFLLGVPATSAIAFGNTTTRLRGAAYDAYVTDDWRLSGLTLNLGVRWEYEAPFTEASGRLASPLRPDRRGFEPRLAASWRPVLGSSLVLRASYGLYRNPGAYQPLALLLAQQPPFTRTFSVQNGPLTPLTLANPFPSSIPTTSTFAVDPDYRTADAHTWQVSAQRDLPASLTVIVAYLGAKGTHLIQASLPNTYPAGTDNPCPACPSGFVFVSSNGSSLRNAGQFTVRRRLHNGLMASAQYTLATSTDDAATFSNTAVAPHSLSVAQDWLDLSAERGPSSFDQRHLVTLQFQYTSGVGVAGGTLVDGVWGTLFKDWTIGTQLTAGSGLPFTPVSFLAVAGTGFVGVRPRLTGVPLEPAPPGAYANPAAYTAPLPGAWGDAGRNSIRGPSQFALDASVSRVFRLRGRLNLEWRVAATNVLNHVTFATINTVVSSPQFGRPTLANPMRRLQATLRLRF